MIGIDTDSYANCGIEVFRFPGGEWHANVPRWRTKIAHVFAKIRTWDDMGKLLVVGSALASQGVEVHVFSPYLPGARQDRNPNGLTPLTSELYGKLFATFATSVTAVDIHSTTAEDRFEDGFGEAPRNIKSDMFLRDLITRPPGAIISPDKGAASRAHEAAWLFECKVVVCEKDREYETGKLTGFKVPKNLPELYEPDTRFLIVDDICDGGGTFVGLLEEFRKVMPHAPVDLFVTHGIFSKGLGPLSAFENIYTTNSFYTPPQSELLTKANTIDLLPYYFGGLRP
jgi:ribose-phosphate pyrophosphokinase